MDNIQSSRDDSDFKDISGNKKMAGQKRVKELTDALNGDAVVRARIKEITDAFMSLPQPKLRELNDQEKEMQTHYVFFSPATYIQNAFDHIDHDITLYKIDGKQVASTFAINGTLESAKAFKKRSSDDIYLGIGKESGTRNMWNKE